MRKLKNIRRRVGAGSVALAAAVALSVGLASPARADGTAQGGLGLTDAQLATLTTWLAELNSNSQLDELDLQMQLQLQQREYQDLSNLIKKLTDAEGAVITAQMEQQVNQQEFADVSGVIEPMIEVYAPPAPTS